MKKKTIIKMLIIAVLVIPILGYLYCSYNPLIHISAMRNIGSEGRNEQLLIAMSTYFGVPVAKEIDEKCKEIGEWNNAIVVELAEKARAPRDIQVTGEVVDGKTILRYEGYYTTEDGQTVQYFEEKTFDFVLVPDEELPK